MAEADAQETKCLKRRRRSPAEHLPHTFHLDQTTTTIKRSSRFRGVSRHRWTGRFEAHLWDKGSWNETQKKKGKQVYLGAYDEEEAAARVYDLAAIKYWGASTYTNFPMSDYKKDIETMQNVTKEEYLASLRRRSSGFSRGVSKYRGVARHHHNGRWEARIGRVFGNKYLYLGTYGTQEEAAHAYDVAAVEYRGINAVTNFDLSSYIRWLRPGESSEGPQGLTAAENVILQADSNCLSLSKETDFSNTNSFTIKNPAISEKHEIIERKMPLSPSWSKATSPTALGLLLRSSMFKELVEKTTTTTTITGVAADEEKDEETTGGDEFTFYGEDDHGLARGAMIERGQPFWNAL